MTTRIAFVGLGKMGEPMAKVLLNAGYEVTVVPHVRREPAERLAALGARVADTGAAAAADADFAITMVPNLPEVEEAVFGAGGLAETARPGTVIINMSTVSPTGIRALAARLADRGIGLCDAPVSGGPVRAADGTLTIMAGAEKEVYERSLDVLKALGQNIFHTGGVGTGQIAKLCNNMLGAILMAASSEVLTMGAKAGLDAHVLREVILKSTGANYQLEHWMPRNVMIDEYEAGFALKLMYKDIGIARDLARECGAVMPIGNLVHELYGIFQQSELREKDFSVISTFYQDAANITIADGQPRSRK